jgi:CheY-like chemotaxis protein
VVVSTGCSEVGAADLARWEDASALQPGRYAWLEVRDAGSGMDEETRSRIFDPFFSTKERGHGLGLSAVLGLVRAHGGGLSLETSPGRGTCFRVHLPVADVDLAVPEARPANDGRLAATVLIVDDEPAIRRLCRRLLAARGCQVLEAADGLEAVDVFHAHADEIDVAVLDLSMPRRGGMEVLRELRRERPELPILLASGFDHQGVAQETAPDARTAFVGKPFGAVELVAALRRLLGKDLEKELGKELGEEDGG